MNKGLKWLLALVFSVAFIGGGCNEATYSPPEQQRRIEDYLISQHFVDNVYGWKYDHGEGLVIQTPHYDIYTTMTDSLMLRQLPVFMENLHKQYCQLSGIDGRTSQKYTLYLFQSRDQWEQFGEGFTGEDWQVYQRIQKGAYYTNGACVAYNIGRTDTFGVIAHEGWHQFSHRHFKYRLPAWLDEGLAMQFEGFANNKGNYIFSPELNYMRLDGLQESFESRRIPLLTTILAENPAAVISRADDENKSLETNAYYGRTYALIRFLNEYGGGIYRSKLKAMIIGMRDGSWKTDAELSQFLVDRNQPLTTEINTRVGIKLFTDYYGENLRTIEKQFDTYCYWLLLKHTGE